MILLAAILACADCHKGIVDGYRRTPMANSSGTVRASSEAAGVVSHPSAHYQIHVSGDRLNLSWSKHSTDLSFFIGSRRMGRSYAYRYEDHLYQAPVGYYANRRKWDMAPGYEQDRAPDFSRPIGVECLFCHATRFQLVQGTVNRYAELTPGIGCARCHGDPADHGGIVNPAKLAPRLRDSVCEQCHLSGAARIPRQGARIADFKPGEDLSRYVEVFTGGEPGSGVKVNGHAEALAQSSCKQASGDRLWCGTCHSPHRAPDYRAACTSCHGKPHSTGDCASCHMTKSRANDGGHTVFTNHAIGKTKQRAFGSYFGREPSPRDLGLAYAEIATRNRDTALLERAWPLLRQASASPDPAVDAAIAGMLAADGKTEQAVAFYRRSLAGDSLQPAVLLKLAELLKSSAERERALRMLPRPPF